MNNTFLKHITIILKAVMCTDQEKIKSGMENFWDPMQNKNSLLVLVSMSIASGTMCHIDGENLKGPQP